MPSTTELWGKSSLNTAGIWFILAVAQFGFRNAKLGSPSLQESFLPAVDIDLLAQQPRHNVLPMVHNYTPYKTSAGDISPLRPCAT
jgi:hypothetical protein